jgi:RNA polymerase sigma factor (sigma-70 family)
MGSATRAHIPPRTRPLGSRRLLRLAGDDRLVQQIRRGSEAAFEVAFERHSPAILGYCRHMLGSPEEAEDAVQHTFVAAYSDLQRGGEREIALKPWLFTIARNRCLSMLRARREHALEQPELVTAGLAEQVERRAELRQLLADLRGLPEEQRDALLLAEVGGLPQAEIADVLGCEVSRVKGLVYRARSALIAQRSARELPCEQVREQLATLRGGSLRRAELRLHVRDCPGCRAFREEVRRQRQLMSVALPVVPTLSLKASVFAAAGVSAGAAGGGGAAAAGLLGGGSVVAKLAVAGVLVVSGGTAAVVAERQGDPAPRPETSEPAGARNMGPGPAFTPAPGKGGSSAVGTRGRESGAPDGRARGDGRPGADGRARGNGRARGLGRGPANGAPGAAPGNGRALGKQLGKERGRGPVATPPVDTPVRRGPAEGRGKPDQAGPPANANGNGKGQAQGEAKAAPPPADGEAEAEDPEPAGGPPGQSKPKR